MEATAAPTAEAGAPPASEAADAAAPTASAAPAAPGANPEQELEDLARRIYPRISSPAVTCCSTSSVTAATRRCPGRRRARLVLHFVIDVGDESLGRWQYEGHQVEWEV